MQWFRSFVLVAALLTLLAACSSSETPTPEPEQAPAQSAPQETPEQPAQKAPEQHQAQMAQMQPCKIQNVDDQACTTELAKALTDILLAQGEGETAARQAGEAIANAIKDAPVDKRNGFAMSGPDTGNRYSFMFQNESGDAYLVLFQKKEGGGENEYEMITARPMPSCTCAP